MSNSRIFYIGESALNAFQVGLAVTSNNIANADSENYSRRRVEFEEVVPPDRVMAGELGRGVEVARIVTLRDEYLTRDYLTRYADKADHSTRRPLIGVLEGLLTPDEEYGLSARLEKYWDSWDDLSNEPWGESQRQAVISEAQTVAAYIQSIKAEFTTMSKQLEVNYEQGVTEINRLTMEIADVNEKLRIAELDGETSGSFRDSRDALLNELSEFVGYNYYEDTDGTINVHMANGKALVQGDRYYTLSTAETTMPDGSIQTRVFWSGDNSDITDTITGGQMGAWTYVNEAVIPQFKDNLDELAKGIIWEVNQLHSQGVGLTTMTSASSSYVVASTDTTIDDGDVALAEAASGLDFYDKLQTPGYFKILVYDADGAATAHKIEYDSTTTLNDLAGDINAITNMSATVSGGRIFIDAATDHSFAFGEIVSHDETTGTDTRNSNLLAVLGINTFWTGSSADDIAVNQTVIADHNLINAGFIAGVEENDIPPVNGKTGAFEDGDNRNALAIAGLRQTRVDLVQSTYSLPAGATTQTVSLTLGEFLGNMVGQIGTIGNESVTNENFHDMMLNQLEMMIQDKSGVNLDEEMVNLLRYQRAYQAAARIITTADEMLQTLMQI